MDPTAVAVRFAKTEEIEAAWSGDPRPGWEGRFSDGERFKALRGAAGDHRFAYGDLATFHLSADQGVLSCSPVDELDPAWQRVLLDSVFFSLGLLRGYEALHAAAVEIDGSAHAIVAASGGGKSTLCGELLRRGHALVADDVVILSREREAILAHPGPPVMNLPKDRAGGLGHPAAAFDDEIWTEVPVVPAPLPLKSVTLLRRDQDCEAELNRLDPVPLSMLPHLLRFPRTAERERSRFHFACDLAGLELWELRAHRSVAPGLLADLIESASPAELCA